jgi:RNA ligase (TIGR02306 family)
MKEETSVRKLASIQAVAGVRPIDGADAIEVVEILGWNVVSKKGDFAVGDLVVYFEVDSFLSADNPAFASFEPRFTNWGTKRGMRLKTIKLRGQISQGLVLSPNVFPALSGERLHVGQDVTELLGIEKWEREENLSRPGGGASTSVPFPSFIPKTDQERIQNCTGKIMDVLDEVFEVTLKLDGSSMTVYSLNKHSPHFAEVAAKRKERSQRKMNFFQKAVQHVKGFFNKQPEMVFGVCSRNIELGLSDDNHFSKYVRENGVIEKLQRLGGSYAFQGELIAPGIQGNYEKVKGFEWHVFSVYDIDTQEYMQPDMASLLVENIGLSYVPIHNVTTLRELLPDTSSAKAVVDGLLALAEGPGMNPGVKREGLVFKSLESGFSFKAISQSYLLKEK